MKNYQTYLNEVVSHNERNFLGNDATTLTVILNESGIANPKIKGLIKDAKFAGYGGREYIQFTFRGKRYEVIQVDQPED